MAEETPNPLAAVEETPTASPSSDGGMTFEDEVSAGRAVNEGRVNIKDVLSDSQSYRGINHMCISLLQIFIGFKFLGQLTDETFAKNNVQLKEWALPSVADIQDPTLMAEFAYRWYSRLLDDPVVDGHNRALMAYLGTGGTTGDSGRWPDEACEFPNSKFPDEHGKMRGQYPSEPGKAYPFESYRLPCMRELHYVNDDYHENEDALTEIRGEQYGTSHFSDPVLMGKYNFSAVMHWHNHDYPLIYAASIKQQNISHVRDAIDQAAAFIAQQDPLDIRMGVYLYNPATKTVAEVEMQFFRTFGTAHRRAGILINLFSAVGRSDSYWFWGVALVLSFFVSVARHAEAAWFATKYEAVYQRARSDYLWKRWRYRGEGEHETPKRRGGFCCEMTGCCCCCPCFSGQFSGWAMVMTFSVILQLINCMLVGRSIRGVAQGEPTWDSLPPANSAESLADGAEEWGNILQEGKSARPGVFDIHTHLLITGFSNLLLVLLLLKDLAWHDGIGVLANTLSFAAKDLQDICVVTGILLVGFGSFAMAVFGTFGTQDIFATLGSSISNLALLGFGKQLGYDEVVNDGRGIRFAGAGMGPLGGVKPFIFWILLVLFIFVIPNIILAVIVEGFERHVDVANQRIKTTLFQLMRRRIFLQLWKLQRKGKEFQPKWARQLAVAGSPAAMAAFDGLLSPSGALLPVEVRDHYLSSRKLHKFSKDEVVSRLQAKKLEHRLFFSITTAADLEALLRFGVEKSRGRGAFTDDEISALAQDVWQLYSRDPEGNGWAQLVEEDHSHSAVEGGGGNHIRAVVRNELRPVGERLVSNTEQIAAIHSQLAATQQQLATLMSMVENINNA